MSEYWQRNSLQFSEKGMENLANSTVLVAGCGGVGSFAIEALARSGIGKLILIDKDTIEESNINRQLPALRNTVGQPKTKLLKERIALINPDCEVIDLHEWYDSNMNERLLAYKPDYVLDAIDSMSAKQDLIRFALDNDIPLISSMGMARRMDPSKLDIMELEKTTYDPMAKILRTWKRKNKIRKKIMTVCSSEKPMQMEKGSVLPSSIFVPGSAGLMMASKCVSDLLAKGAVNE